MLTPLTSETIYDCMQTFSVHDVMSCPNGGLIIARHNEICDEIIHLERQAFSPNFVRSEPLIHLLCSILEEDFSHGGRVPETYYGVSIQGLWEIRMEAIIDVIFGDADADTWKKDGMDKLLGWWGGSRRTNTGRLAMINGNIFLCLSSRLMG